MRKFVFNLEPLYGHRQRLEELSQKEFAEVNLTCQAEEKKLIDLIGLYKRSASELDSLKEEGASSNYIETHQAYLEGLKRRIKSQEASVAKIRVLVEKKPMMWIDGVAPLDVTHAYVAAAVALLVFGLIAGRQQQTYQPIQKDACPDARVDWARVGVVAWILLAAIATNVFVNTQYPQFSDVFPFLGAAVWVAILLAAPVRKPEWSLLPEATKGSVFLLSLVVCASMMPVEQLPSASWQTAFSLGFISAVFDNIPLTALALTQGGYDWGVLAYAVGFGGSMIWFGSSAGVALSNLFPEAKSVGAWIKGGWHVTVAYT